MKLIATNEYHSTPISKRLPSNFIELAFGAADTGLGAEMFFNRSFEPFRPYRLIFKIVNYMLEDENNFSSRYEPDWRKFEWYNSSYEHNAWFAFPNVAGYQPVRDDSTIIIETSSDGLVHIELTEDPGHGKCAMRVINGAETGGLAQDGKYCAAGESYVFRGKIRKVCGEGTLRAAFYHEGTTENPVCIAELNNPGEEYTEVSAQLRVPENGRYTFVLLTPENSEIICDDFSLKNKNSPHGFKKEVIEAGRYIGPRVIRWPGGCFASFYNWRDGVGKDRPPTDSIFWGGYQYNDLGTDELASYAEAVGGESMVCVNLFHPLKRYYEFVPPEAQGLDPNDRKLPAAAHGLDALQFADKANGAEEAAAWVEYCNGDLSTEGGRARAANGREKPYHIRYWEMDNEVHRWFGAEEYAETCVLYSKAMKAVDPGIRIGMVSYGYPYEKIRKMLEIAGEHIDFFADRGIEESELEYKLGMIAEYNRAHGTDIRWCNTEWVPMNGADVYNMVPKSERVVHRESIFSKWSYALETAQNLLTWQRHGDAVDFACFSTYANTHAQSVIAAAKEGVTVAPSGMILHQFANTKAYRTFVIEDYKPRRSDALQVQLAETETGDSLVLNVLNRGETDDTLLLDLSAFNIRDGVYGGTILCGDRLLSADNQIREETASVAVNGNKLEMNVRRLSFAEVVIPLERDPAGAD